MRTPAHDRRTLRRRPATLHIMTFALLAVAVRAPAASVSVLGYESAASLGMGGAGSALRGRPGNAATAPAALAGATEATLALGAQAVWVNGKYRDGNPALDGEIKEQILPLPHGQFVLPVSEELTFAVAVAAPEAHSVTWRWGGNRRGDALLEESTLAIAALTPSLAWAVSDRVAVSAGPQFVYCATHEIDALSRDARGRRRWHSTDADGRGFGGLFSANVVLAPEWTAAARFATGARLDMQYEAGGVSGPASGTMLGDLRTPMQGGAGVATTAVRDWTFAADLLFSAWDFFDGAAGSRFEDDTLAVAVGAEYRIDDEWRLRAGYLFDEGRSYEAAMIPGGPVGDRHVLSIGAGYSPDGRRGVDAALSQTRGESLASDVAGLPGRWDDFQRWTLAATGWWRF